MRIIENNNLYLKVKEYEGQNISKIGRLVFTIHGYDVYLLPNGLMLLERYFPNDSFIDNNIKDGEIWYYLYDIMKDEYNESNYVGYAHEYDGFKFRPTNEQFM